MPPSLLAIPLFLIIFYFIIRRLFLITSLKWIQGPPALPLFGNLFDFCLIPPQESFRKMSLFNRKYRGIYKLWLGPQPVVHCQDPEIVQLLLKKEDCTRKAELYHFMGKFIGSTGLLTSETDDIWRSHRKLLSSSFHLDVLESIVGQTVEKAAVLTEYLERFVGLKEPIDLIKVMKPSAFDTSIKTMAGLESSTLDKTDSHDYLDAVEKMSVVVMSRVFLPLLKYNLVFSFTQMRKMEEQMIKTMHQFCDEIVRKKKMLLNKDKEMKTSLANDVKKRKSIIETLLDSNLISSEKLTDQNISDQVNTHIFAGYDTLGTSTSFALFLLGHHPDIQTQVVEELNTVMPDFPNCEIGLKDVNRLDLLDRCLKEAMRLFPPAPMIGRRVARGIDTSKGTLPPGLNVYINIYNYHRNEQVFQDPFKFDPDRFLPENVDLRKPNTYIPFGAGIRICIGQKMALLQGKLYIASILKKFVVKSVEKMEDLELIANLVLKSKSGILVNLEKR